MQERKATSTVNKLRLKSAQYLDQHEGAVGLGLIGYHLWLMLAALAFLWNRSFLFGHFARLASLADGVRFPWPLRGFEASDSSYRMVIDLALGSTLIFSALAIAFRKAGYWIQFVLKFIPWLAFFFVATPQLSFGLDGGFHVAKVLGVFVMLASPNPGNEHRRLLAAFALLSIQVQVCFLYLSAFFHKVTGVQWQNGTALYYVFQNLDLVDAWLGNLLARAGVWIVVCSYLALSFQLLFPFFIWNEGLRRTLLWAGVAFHSSTALMMKIWFFSSILLVSYLFFLRKPEIEALRVRWRELRQTLSK